MQESWFLGILGCKTRLAAGRTLVGCFFRLDLGNLIRPCTDT